MPHLSCGSCGAVHLVNVEDHLGFIVEALRDHPDTQKAWVQSRTIAEKGAQFGPDHLLALIEEQEAMEPEKLTDFYWSWIFTLGIARALAVCAKNRPVSDTGVGQ